MPKPKYYVARTKSTGRGLFAARRLRPGEKIFAVKGSVMRDAYGPNYLIGKTWLCLSRGKWLAPTRQSPWFYINHSCQPNCGLRGTVTVVPMKPIPPGAELTIDYSTTEEDPYWRMRCGCGSKNCRGVIRSVSFLPEALARKYWPYIPRYLQRAYLRSRATA